jgi:hypothetical protein
MNAPMKPPTNPLVRQSLRTTTVLLLDTSGSMSMGEPRRIDLLWQMVQALRTPQSRWRVATFNTYCTWVGLVAVPEPDGVTDLARAFTYIKQANPLRVTLVTDGQPDDQDEAYEAALALQCPVNILFVGDEGDEYAVTFCRRVCTATKGEFATEVLSVQALEHTTATMRKMLGAGTPTSTTIAL